MFLPTPAACLTPHSTAALLALVQEYDLIRLEYEALRTDYERLKAANSPRAEAAEEKFLTAYNKQQEARTKMVRMQDEGGLNRVQRSVHLHNLSPPFLPHRCRSWTPLAKKR